MIVRRVAHRAGITKKVGLHTLRHVLSAVPGEAPAGFDATGRRLGIAGHGW